MNKFQKRLLFSGVLLLVLLIYSLLYNIKLKDYEATSYQIVYSTIYLWGVRPLLYLLASYLIASLLCLWNHQNIPGFIVRLCMVAGILLLGLYVIILSGILPSSVKFFVLVHPVLFVIPGICIAIGTGGSQNG